MKLLALGELRNECLASRRIELMCILIFFGQHLTLRSHSLRSNFYPGFSGSTHAHTFRCVSTAETRWRSNCRFNFLHSKVICRKRSAFLDRWTVLKLKQLKPTVLKKLSFTIIVKPIFSRETVYRLGAKPWGWRVGASSNWRTNRLRTDDG